LPFRTGVALQNEIPQVLRNGSKRMLTEKRNRGGQPANFNALKHGRRSPRKRAERRAKSQVAFDERRARERAWSAAEPTIDYHAICNAIMARDAPNTRGLN
jgi:hypothetical protein